MAPQTPMGSCRVKHTKFSSARQESKRAQNSQNPHFSRCVGDRTKPLLDREHCLFIPTHVFVQMKSWVQLLCQPESQTALTVTQEPLKTRAQFLLQTPCVEAEGRITHYHTAMSKQISYRLSHWKTQSTCLLEGESFKTHFIQESCSVWQELHSWWEIITRWNSGTKAVPFTLKYCCCSFTEKAARTFAFQIHSCWTPSFFGKMWQRARTFLMMLFPSDFKSGQTRSVQTSKALHHSEWGWQISVYMTDMASLAVCTDWTSSALQSPSSDD